MIREINKKKFLLENRKPFSKAITDYMKEIWLSEWIYTSNKLSGCALTLNESLFILKGQYILNKTIQDHMIVKNHEDAIAYIEKSIALKSSLNLRRIWELHNILALEEQDRFREKNPVLQYIQYIPPHFKDVFNLMDAFVAWYKEQTKDMNPILRGVLMHHKCIEIYPFSKDTEKTARALLNYELLKYGLPPIDFEIENEGYYNLTTKYLKKHDHIEFYEAVCKKVYLRLELFLRLTYHE